MDKSYYVYVYIDPRNFEEFYYGKGKGARKNAHLKDQSDTEKTRIISAIQAEGSEPIIKVIAADLSEQEALLIEKTLIWKLGRNLTNISSGHFSKKFRPHDTFHKDVHGFDYQNGIYYINVGEGDHRSWQDCRELGFLSAGQSPKYSDPIRTLLPGDIVVAYLKNKGYVGVGIVKDYAKKPTEFHVDSNPLMNYPLEEKGIFHNHDNENSEYLVKINWKKSLESNDAKWESNYGLFTTPAVKASLENQKITTDYIEQEFEISFDELQT